MTGSESLFSGRAVQENAWLLVVCGIALLLSIPSGDAVEDALRNSWTPSPLVFVAIYVLTLSFQGALRGASAARWGLPSRAVPGTLLRHVLFSQLIALPCLLFARALLPGVEFAWALLLLHATLASFAFSLLAFRVARWGASRQAQTSLLPALLVSLALGLPCILDLLPQVPAIVRLASPIGVALTIARSPTVAELLVAFLFAAIAMSSQWLGIRRSSRRIQHV